MSYRKDDGRYARMFAFWALFGLVGYGCFHGGGLVDELGFMMGESDQTFVETFPLLGTLKTSTCIAIGIWVAVGLVLRGILNKKRIADALIDTEGEMQKVTWPTWGETWQGTMAVAVMVAVLFVYLFGCDLGLASVMQMLLGGGGA